MGELRRLPSRKSASPPAPPGAEATIHDLAAALRRRADGERPRWRPVLQFTLLGRTVALLRAY